jgi:hypothetical protein
MKLNVFTHDVGNPTIDKTIESFRETFGDIPTQIWRDEGEGLAYNYIKAIESTDSEFMFMLEHDWLFLDTIKHDLKEICDMMGCFPHLRFNKRANKPAKWDKVMMDGGQVCVTNNISNNPHIIQKSKYLQWMKYIKPQSGSGGIEQELNKQGLAGLVYGGYNHPATIKHIG